MPQSPLGLSMSSAVSRPTARRFSPVWLSARSRSNETKILRKLMACLGFRPVSSLGLIMQRVSIAQASSGYSRYSASKMSQTVGKRCSPAYKHTSPIMVCVSSLGQLIRKGTSCARICRFGPVSTYCLKMSCVQQCQRNLVVTCTNMSDSTSFIFLCCSMRSRMVLRKLFKVYVAKASSRASTTSARCGSDSAGTASPSAKVPKVRSSTDAKYRNSSWPRFSSASENFREEVVAMGSPRRPAAAGCLPRRFRWYKLALFPKPLAAGDPGIASSLLYASVCFFGALAMASLCSINASHCSALAASSSVMRQYIFSISSLSFSP
mmetsp:Transcript_107429/g.256706  ORF Transcript_107429/g.256706 Transcript_107429/m.256706 type:complete len:322 (-) Transcript_107429:592-1557(-)